MFLSLFGFIFSVSPPTIPVYPFFCFILCFLLFQLSLDLPTPILCGVLADLVFRIMVAYGFNVSIFQKIVLCLSFTFWFLKQLWWGPDSVQGRVWDYSWKLSLL